MTAHPGIHFAFYIFALCLLTCGLGAVATAPAHAVANGQAAQTANGELATCNGSGPAVRDCVAGVLDRMADRVAAELPETSRALRTAAVGVRAAVNKVQALSAISKCQALISGALNRVRAMGGGKTLLQGWGEEIGLTPVARVLARMAQLIQTKG
jgi:hypothetical protein